MGAHTFTNSNGGPKMMPREAYEKLCREAEYQHGHDTYNGTISTTTGFVMVDPGKRRPQTVIREIFDDENSHIRKWGPAGCIELKGTALKDWKARNGFKGRKNIRAYIFFGWAAS